MPKSRFWALFASAPVLLCGANYNNNNAKYGLSYCNYNNANNNNNNFGARLLEGILSIIYCTPNRPWVTGVTLPLGKNIIIQDCV